MKATSIRLKTPLSNETASNRFLRALWAELRAEFGKLAWQYSPNRYGAEQTIFFGYADLGLPETIRIGITYKKRGVIEQVVFWDLFSRTDLPKARIERCVRLAENATETEITISAEIHVPYDLHFQNMQGPSLSILTEENKTTYLYLQIHAFDEADADHKFALHTKPILDVLSSFTNLHLSLGPVAHLLPSPFAYHSIGSSPSLDWLDGLPVENRTLIVPEHCFAFIDDIILDDLDEQKQKLVDACHHFHAARALEEQSYSFPSKQSVAAEMALVLYLSSLEVLSLIGAPPPTTCSTCSQPQYRISARVTDFMEKHNGPAVAQVVKELYNARSKYLHAGRLLSTRSYTGKVIPQLDSSSTNGVRSPMPLVPLLNLREFTSFCIRAVTYELTSGEQIIAPDYEA